MPSLVNVKLIVTPFEWVKSDLEPVVNPISYLDFVVSHQKLKMSLSQVANAVEKITGHQNNTITAQDITNPERDHGKYGHPTETMLALTWQGKGDVKVVEVPKPIVVESRDVILKVTGSTVCGSDLHLLHGAIIQLQKGDILGHEFCGVVEDAGDGAKERLKQRGIDVGSRVVASFQIACGECGMCQQKLSSQCEKTNANTTQWGMYGGHTAGMFGYSHFTGGFAGGQAEMVRVPLGDVNLLKLPDSVPDEMGLYLSDVLVTSWHCVVDTGVKQGDIVAVWGAGPIGQMCVDFAFMHGASRVILIDANWRLDFVKEKIPKVELLDYSKLPRGASVTSKLKEMVPGGGPNVALECVAGEYPKGWAHYFELLLGMETDTSEIVNEMITSVRSFGRCGITGVYAGFSNHFNIGSLMERGVKLNGNGQAPVHLYWEELLQKIQSNEIEPLKMLSHRVRLEDLATVYKLFEAREDGMQKVFVQTKFSNTPCNGSPELKVY